MTAKRHDWFRFHATDWLLGTVGMTLEQQGMYLRLLAVQWREGSIRLELKEKLDNSSTEVRLLSENTLTDVRLLSRLCPTILREKFEKSEYGWVNKRLEKERQLQVAKHDRLSEAGRKGGLMSKPPPSIKKENKKENNIPQEKLNESKHDSEMQDLAVMWRDMSRSKNNGWPKENEWDRIKSGWVQQINLLLTKDNFTKDQFIAVVNAFKSGALDSGDFVWARDAVKSPIKLRKPDKDGMVYMQVILNRLEALKPETPGDAILDGYTHGEGK